MAFNINPFVPFDSNAVMQPKTNIGDMLQAGLQGFQGGQQMQEQMKQKAFGDALTSELQTGEHDYKTPEGQASLVKALAAKGFGPEAMNLASKMKPLLQAKDYKMVQTSKGGAGFDQTTGTYTAPNPDITPPDLQHEIFATVKKNGVNMRFNKVTGEYSSLEGPDDNAKPITQPSADAQTLGPDAPAQEKPAKKVSSAISARSYLSTFDKAKTNYEKNVAQPYLMVEGIKKSDSYGTSLGDQSMIDQLVQMETNGKPTEAQYESVAKNLGISDRFDRATMRFLPGSDGAILGPSARKNLESQILEQTKQKHLAFSRELGQDSTMAKKAGLDPGTVIRPGGYFDQVDQGIRNTPQSAQPATSRRPQDSEAVQWAKSNPKDPRAAAILKANGL